MSSLHCSFADKIIEDLIKAIKADSSLVSFEIVATATNENRNSSPVLRGEGTLGLESWVLKHVLPHATQQILDGTVRKDPDRLIPYLSTVNLINPDMPSAWGRRKELLLMRRLSFKDELRLTRMVLSWKPKCNAALAHRRWLITKKLIPGDKLLILREELNLTSILADYYHSNYHAWTHRLWAMQNLVPVNASAQFQSSVLLDEFTKRDMCTLFIFTHLPTYLAELEDNLEFVTSHVSDHSGLHYRKFLISQIFLIFRNYQNNSCFAVDLPSIESEQGKEALLHYSSLKKRLKKFLAHHKVSSLLTDYSNHLDVQFTIFDVLLSILIDEMNSNLSLNQLYLDHEALWTFRRFLMYNFQLLSNEIKVVSNSSHGDKDSKNISGDVEILLALIRSDEEAAIKRFSGCPSVDAFSRWLSKNF